MEKIKSWGAYILKGMALSLKFTVYLVGFILVCWILNKMIVFLSIENWYESITIDRIYHWARLLIAYAALFASVEYISRYEERADAKTKTALEFVGFFRDKLLRSEWEMKRLLSKKKIIIPQLPNRKNSRTLIFSKDDFDKKTWTSQKGLVETYNDIVSRDVEVEYSILYCLNTVEEFSIGIMNTKSKAHLAMSSIKKPFVELIETLAIPLYVRIGVMDDKFSYTAKLYQIWKKEIGYIPKTNDERMELLNQRVASYKKS